MNVSAVLPSSSTSTTTPASTPAARRLARGAVALVGVSVVGGTVSVLSGTNTWSDAWTAEATLAAPWPIVLVQGAAAVAAVGRRRRPALAGSAALLAGALLSAVSGFFDGQLGRDGLGAGYVAMQLVVVLVAGTVVVLAGQRLGELRRGGHDRAGVR